jgi:ribosomal protein L10
MELKSKNYKSTKIKSILKKKNLIFLFHSIDVNSKRWVKIEQNLFKNNLSYYRINIFLLNLILKTSIFLNLTNLIKGPVIYIYLKDIFQKNLLLKDFFNISNKLHMLCIIFKKKLYSIKSILNLTTLKFVNNINYIKYFLKYFIRTLFISSFLILNKKIISK